MRSTVTVARRTVHEDFDITVVVSHGLVTPDRVVAALDEDGRRVRLTRDEREHALALSHAGIDQTGR
jgi:hypothetical protein